MRIIAAMLLCTLAGCVTGQTAEERAQRIVDRYGPACTASGLKPDSQRWIDCLVDRHRAQELHDMQLRAAALAALPKYEPPRPLPMPTFYTPPKQTICRSVGYEVHCTTQ